MKAGKNIGPVVLLFIFLFQNTYSQEYNYRTLGTSEGLAQPYVYSVVQDSHGYLWIGTGEGLSKYDGLGIESFTVSDSLSENFITTSFCKGDYVWFGHRNGDVTVWDGKRFRSIKSREKKLSSVTYMSESPDGRIIMSTANEGLFVVDRYEIVPVALFPPEITGINCFEFINSNEFLVGTLAGLFRYIKGNSPEDSRIIQVGEIPVTGIPAVRKRKNGNGFLIATSDDGLFELTIKKNEFHAEKLFTQLNFFPASVQSVCEDKRGNIWIGTFGNGLLKVFRNNSGVDSVTGYNVSTGFVTDNVKTVYEDNEGNIWSGNYGEGITQISPKLFKLLTFDKRTYGNNIFSVLPDSECIWLGTDQGLLKADRATGRVISFFGKENGLPEDTVTAVLKSGKNEIWVGTDRNGLYRLNPGSGRAVRYQTADGALENSITSLACQDSLIWAGTRKGLFRIDPRSNEKTLYSVSQGGLPHNWVNNLFTDREGMLWITTHSSIIAYITRGELMRMPISSVPGTMTLGPVAEDGFSRIWVGSKGNGVYIIESDSAMSITSREGMFSDYSYSMAGDGKNIWVGHKGALSRINTDDLMVNQFRHSADLPAEYNLNLNASASDETNKIYFGSDIGLICYDHEGDDIGGVPPVLNITSVWINDQQGEINNGSIVLSPGSYKIRFNFIGISLREPDMVNYQYKLNNYDQWSDITKSTTVTYNHLTEGNYSFMLKAYGGDGSAAMNPLIINVVIKKPLWKKWWFYAICILVLAILVWVYVKWRLNMLVGEKKILEDKVNERTREIQVQKTEIENQRDLILKKSNNITSSITYASTIQNAVLPSPELIGKHLPESFILSKPRDIVSGDFYWLTEQKGKIIIAVADCTGHGVPGAFMSLLGITLLNEIVDTHGITSSDKIVTRLRERVIQLLHQDRSDITTRDGMEINLCVIDQREKTLQYTGAMNDLLIVSGGRLSVIKADRMSVGASEKYEKFSLNELEYREGDLIYLFSDGYKDQFGGEFDKKFLKTAFYTTLFEVSSMTVKRQKEFLENKLSDWMKNSEQTDDITVMGIRL